MQGLGGGQGGLLKSCGRHVGDCRLDWLHVYVSGFKRHRVSCKGISPPSFLPEALLRGTLSGSCVLARSFLSCPVLCGSAGRVLLYGRCFPCWKPTLAVRPSGEPTDARPPPRRWATSHG